MSTKLTPPEEIKLRAVLDGRRLPIKLFGGPNATGRLRKFVWLYIATHCNPDGTNGCVGRKAIARDCGVTVKTASNIVRWLVAHRLLLKADEKSEWGTNRYTLLMSPEDIAECEDLLAKDTDNQEKAAKAKLTHEKRSRAAKDREARAAKKREARKKSGSDGGEHSVPLGRERCIPYPPQTGGERSVPGGGEYAVVGGNTGCSRGERCVPPSVCPSIDRPSFFLENQNLQAKPAAKVESDMGLTELNAVLARVANGRPFTSQLYRGLADLRKRYSSTDIIGGFRLFYDACEPGQRPYAQKDFIEGGADAAILNARENKQKSAETAIMIERTKIQLREQADAELRLRDAQRAEEAELFEDELPGSEERSAATV